MSLDKAIEHGKERRRPYRGAKAIDPTCRNHGSCPVCEENRKHKFRDKNPMDNIVDISVCKQHCVSELICIKCGKRWIGVWPKETLLKDIACENCGPGFVIKTGQDLEDEEE